MKNLLLAGERLFVLALMLVLVVKYSEIVSAVGLVGSQSISSSGMMSYAPNNTTTGWLHTEGKYIKDSAGNIVRLRGTATLGLQALWGTDQHAMSWNTDAQTADLYSAIASSGANTVRVAINYALMWQSTHGGSLSRPEYIQTMDSIVNYCQQIGLRVIWDFHADYINGVFVEVGSSDWGLIVGAIADSNYIAEKETQLQWLIDRYKNNPTVIGIEILNEPPLPSGAGWDAYTNPARIAFMNSYVTFCDRLAKAIHSVSADYLVFVDAIQVATTLRDWTVNGNKLLDEPNIVYAYHYYNWHFGGTDDFVVSYAAGNYATGKTQMEARYYQRFWYLAEEYNVPIWYGEFGFWDTDVGGGANLQQLIRDQHQVHIDRGYSLNHWGCHVAMGESIVKQYTGTPEQIFNWKGLLWAEYMTR